MMTDNSFDFDKVYDRRNTNSLKWDFAAQRCHEPDELPMWVADMDFPSPEPVKQAVSQAAERGFFGYTDILDADREILSLWYERRHGFRIPSDSIIFLPGTVMGIALAILSFTEPGDSVMVSDPVTMTEN